MTKKQAAKAFVDKWTGRGKEDEDDRSFWIDLLQDVLGQSHVTDRVQFQKKVIGADGNTKRIDAYIPETRVLIEQKSLGIDLSKPQAGHSGKTPYEQAKEYDNQLPVSQKARWIVLSNFAEFWVYDMDAKIPAPQVIALEDLPDKIAAFDFLIKEEVQRITEEVELSVRAGDLVGKIHDRFLEQYHDPMAKHTQNSLNILCVRLVFCLYAEDAGLFGEADAFKSYIEQYEPKDIRRALIDLFKVLDTPEEDRAEMYLDDELAAFPYVNGGLFENENIVIPKITQEIKDTLIESAGFDWSKISPTIFGAVFESTLNQETRRTGGMHYTSIENIHKVIDPLFLNDLKVELIKIKKTAVQKTREKKLRAFQDKLASLVWLDPAAGSGNFLTETYLSIRKLENEVLDELYQGQVVMGEGTASPIKVSIDQFYGIEINDFAVAVARAALWIAESQMMQETAGIVHMDLDFLPLKTNATIIEGNALRMDWEKVIPRHRLSYIISNPPFVGARQMKPWQKEDTMIVFSGWKNAGNLDYVSGWYKKTVDMIKGTGIRAALVSTNSITQGDSVAILWKPLMAAGVHIDFAHRTFRWDSEALMKAHVHCVIVGFSTASFSGVKRIYSNEGIITAEHINAYLADAPDVFVASRNKQVCPVPSIMIGSQPIDDGNYLFTDEEKEQFIKTEPKAAAYFHPWYGSREYINKKPRWVLYLGDCLPSELRSMPECMKRVQAVKDFRLASERKSTLKAADTPQRFGMTCIPESDYIVVPKVSSERRKYIPIGFMPPENFCSDLVFVIPDATKYMLGVLTSNVHMAWMRAVAGRLKSDYRYSKDIVYNNFPWPDPTPDQKAVIEQTAQGILDARDLYPGETFADLYDEATMPPELRKAHQVNDRAVWKAYGRAWAISSEAECVTYLMRRYQDLTK